MRPVVNFLNGELIRKIYNEAQEVLCKIGIEVHNDNVKNLLLEHGAKYNEDKSRILLTWRMIRKSLVTTPNSFKVYDTFGEEVHDFFEDNVCFNPGSAAITVLDYETKKIRKPIVEDYQDYTKIINQLDNIQLQSTAIIPSDIPENISDSYRLLLSLQYCKKPVVTGCFSIESFEVMKDMQLAIRGTEENLKEKPLTIFSCCPTSPLKWSKVTSQNLIDCAKYSIPVEFIAMPLSGFMAPVTLFGTLIQHTAETLSGIVISQCANPGTPILYGGSPAIFDVRHETTPMGAIETMMIDCAYNEIGKFFHLPTQAYISFSDAKQVDAQAGLESGIGATLAALAGINSISGPGMLDFESCQSLEKLVIDNEICGMTFRMLKGISPNGDIPSIPLFEELLSEKHLLISDHTLKNIKEEHFVPSAVINRENSKRWEQGGSSTMEARAHNEIEKMLENYEKPQLSKEQINDLNKIAHNLFNYLPH